MPSGGSSDFTSEILAIDITSYEKKSPLIGTWAVYQNDQAGHAI